VARRPCGSRRFAVGKTFAVLEWTANAGRVLVTHDISTMTHHALERVRGGREMPGVIAVPQRPAIGSVLEDLVLIVTCGTARLLFLPLR